MSGSARKMVAYPAEGVEVSWMTSATYDTAGLIKTTLDGWHRIEHGFSMVAVSGRTRTRYFRHPVATEWTVTAIFEATTGVVHDYFGDHRLVIDSYFVPGKGDVLTGKAHGEGRLSAGRTVIRRLLNEGATQITFRLRGTTKMADFQAAELDRSLKVRREHPRCATVGHASVKATHVITYAQDGETVTEHTCRQCTASYSRRPTLKNFTSQLIGA